MSSVYAVLRRSRRSPKNDKNKKVTILNCSFKYLKIIKADFSLINLLQAFEKQAKQNLIFNF
jgi:hypothetical protein